MAGVCDGCDAVISVAGVDVKGKAARGDVSAVLANALDDPKWTGKVALMQSVGLAERG